MHPLALANGDWILLVVFIATPLAAIAFARAGSVYQQIGKGAFAMDHEQPGAGGSGDGTSRAVHEAEVRQMLEAKAYRQRARGGPDLDVEAELRRLSTPTVDAGSDPQLIDEVRQLVVARNQRRVRAGKEPLDVEAEVERQLRDLDVPGL